MLLSLAFPRDLRTLWIPIEWAGKWDWVILRKPCKTMACKDVSLSPPRLGIPKGWKLCWYMYICVRYITHIYKNDIIYNIYFKYYVCVGNIYMIYICVWRLYIYIYMYIYIYIIYLVHTNYLYVYLNHNIFLYAAPWSICA